MKVMNALAYALLGLLFVTTSCSDGDSERLKTEVIKISSVKDVGNAGNASDVLINFEVVELDGLDIIQFAIFSNQSFTSIDEINVEALPTEALYQQVPSGKIYQIKPSSNFKDSDGNVINSSEPYHLVFLPIINGSVHINEDVKAFSLSDQHVLEGRYVGTWDDNLYTNFGISAELSFSGSFLAGPFYYSSTFTACCGGPNDGIIQVNLMGDVISSFTYAQALDSFMGGSCPGTYEGKGMVQDFIVLEVDFEGTDCEGAHTGGRIKLTKID